MTTFNKVMLQQIQQLLKGEDSHQAAELQVILGELTWDENNRRYVGSQRAVARITGIDRMTLRRGLAMDPNRSVSDPKILKWLAAEGMSGGSIQRQWAAGQIHDTAIAKLIVYAASEKEVRTPEAKRWLNLIAGVGFRGAIHQMKGRGELMERASVRGRNLTHQIKACGRIAQQGGSYQTVRANMVENVTGKVPRHLTNSAIKQGIVIKSSDNWRSHADSKTLSCLSTTEETYAMTGVDLGSDMRDLFMRRGLWDGEVHWQQEAMTVADAEMVGQVDRKKVNQLRQSV